MTQSQLYRKVKSLAWRRRMTENLEELEAEIRGYMLEKRTNSIVVAGYLVELVEKELVLEKMPVIDIKQLKFNFQDNKEIDRHYFFKNNFGH